MSDAEKVAQLSRLVLRLVMAVREHHIHEDGCPQHVDQVSHGDESFAFQCNCFQDVWAL